MGILNVTPDSFSDGGRFMDRDQALQQAERMVLEGADILDIGGESTRPGAAEVAAEEEQSRVIPIIRALRKAHPDTALSIDTSKAAVAEAAIEAGAEIINDVTGLVGDPAMAGVAAATGAGLVLMHMKGVPRTMQVAPKYDDPVAEVREFLEGQGRRAHEAGVAHEHLVFDPGIGFGKGLEHNLQLLKHLDQFGIGGRPVLLGASRKSFISKVLETELNDLESRYWPTVALTAHAVGQGVRVVRVHDVKPNKEAARMMEAVLATK